MGLPLRFIGSTKIQNEFFSLHGIPLIELHIRSHLKNREIVIARDPDNYRETEAISFSV
jgi:hypothetical protein